MKKVGVSEITESVGKKSEDKQEESISRNSSNDNYFAGCNVG